MKKIGFIDFFLDEWHANNYPQWIRQDCAASGRDLEVAYAWADTSRPGELDTASWCKKFQVEPLTSMEELVRKSDYIIVLSPDHPEHHEKLARIPLMSGKPVFVDKTFSPDLKSGVRMFELAGQFRTPMFSSSALRFSKELAGYPNAKVNRETLEFVATLGPGQYTYENYAVHQLEMIVVLLGLGATRIKSLSSEHGQLLVAEYPGGRRASMIQIPAAPFQLSLRLKSGEGVFIPECSDIFTRMIHAMLDFFETGQPPVPKEETLAIMALLEAGGKALASYDTWVKVEQA
jgi:predicted dehydrogenase